MTTIIDILKNTPKTNCGKCGYPTCMAFAASVASGSGNIDRCPFIPERYKRDHKASSNTDGSHEPDIALLRELKAKVGRIDLHSRIEDLGGEISREGMTLYYLGRKIIISPNRINDPTGGELDPRDQILLYNYLFFGGKGELTGLWVGLESFPNSISKVMTLKRYTEDKLAGEFKETPERLKDACLRLGGIVPKECFADLCVTIPVLPKVPIRIHFWDAEPAEGFPAKAKVLFDKRALDFLDIESLIFAAERMAETLVNESSDTDE